MGQNNKMKDSWVSWEKENCYEFNMSNPETRELWEEGYKSNSELWEITSWLYDKHPKIYESYFNGE